MTIRIELYFLLRLLNIGTAKFVAVVMVLVLGGYHSVLHATYGVTPCKGLLAHGMYKVSEQVQSFRCDNDGITGQSVAAMGLHDAQIHTDRHREVRE